MSSRLLSQRPTAIIALVAVIASLAGCAVDPNAPPQKGLFGAMIAPPPQQQPAPQAAFRAPPQAAPAAPAASVADATLQRDVMKMIGGYEAKAGGSKQPLLINARGAGKAGNTYVERWTVNSNGALVEYEVKLTPSASGGVDYAVARLTK